MAERNPHILYCHHTEPAYIPPPRLSEHMISVGPFMVDRSEGDRPLSVTSPKGRYDLAALLEDHSQANAPDVIFVSVDATAHNEPVNLAAFDCPKVALLADTHHLTRPLRNALAYLGEENFDFHIALYNLRHAHFFRNAGLKNVHWLPALNVAGHTAPPVAEETAEEILFIGQTGQYHPRRGRLLDALQAHGLPLRHLQAPAAEAARHYAAARVSFNCSLNGDLNMRLFEIMAAGGMALTDRLSAQSGLDHLFTEGEHFAAYGSAEELIEKAEHYLAHADEAARIAAAGRARYAEYFSPERMAEDLWRLIFDGTPNPLFDPAVDARAAPGGKPPPPVTAARLAAYEHIQERHRVSEAPTLLALPGTPPELLSDAADLPRLTRNLAHPDSAQPDAAAREHFTAAGMAAEIAYIPLGKARERAWDILLAPPAAFDTRTAEIKGGDIQAGLIIVPGLARSDGRAALEKALTARDLARADKQAPVFQRAAGGGGETAGAEPATASAGGRTEAEIARLRESHGLDYQVAHLATADAIAGIRGKRVLEVGGSLPAELVLGEFGAKQWVGIVKRDWRHRPRRPGEPVSEARAEIDRAAQLGDIADAQDLCEHQVLAGAVEDIPDTLAGHFDLIFSTAAFEHFLNFPAALDSMYRALRPGGQLFAMVGPIWSANDGHHLPPITDKSGVEMDFHSSPIPPWGHLLMRPPELYRHLLSKTDAQTAQKIIYDVYHSDFINRLFTEDYASHIQDSPFEVIEIAAAWNIKMDEKLQKALEAAYPGRKHFANNGLRIHLRRPE